MSHFCVMTVRKKGDSLDKAMAPYQENNMGDCPKEFLVFTDRETEMRQEWEQNLETVSAWHPQHTTSLPENAFDTLVKTGRVELSEFEPDLGMMFGTIEPGQRWAIHKSNPGRVRVCVLKVNPDTAETASSELVQPNANGYIHAVVQAIAPVPRNPDEDGKPKGAQKYAVTLASIPPPAERKLQEVYATFEEFAEKYHGFKERDPDHNLYGYYENPKAKWDWWQVGGRWGGSLKLKGAPPDKRVDEARAGDIDWDFMYGSTPEVRERLVRFWEIHVEGREPADDLDKEIAKELVLYKPQYYIDRFGSKERFVDAECAFSTYAVLRYGEWRGQGRMLMFGCSDEKNGAAADWATGFRAEFIDKLDPDDIVAIVDCHI